MPRKRYFVGPGNMSRLVKAELSRRRTWSPCRSLSEADFAWVTYRSKLKGKNSMSRGRRQRLCTNHLEANHHLVSKRGLFQTLVSAGCEGLAPRTFVLQAGVEDESWMAFTACCAELEAMGESIWILKPACGTNRGTGTHTSIYTCFLI